MCLKQIERMLDKVLCEEPTPTVTELIAATRGGDQKSLEELSKMALGDKEGSVRKEVVWLEGELCQK
jgi:hypothetical protein